MPKKYVRIYMKNRVHNIPSHCTFGCDNNRIKRSKCTDAQTDVQST